MEFSTLRICALIVLAACVPAAVLANDPPVTKLQQSFSDQIVTVRIGEMTETRDITIAAYQVLMNQGVPTTLVDMPPAQQDELRQLMIQSTGWSVGVFR